MEELKKQVSRARRRLIMQQFGAVVTWSLFVCLLIAAVAIAIPKIWPIDRLDYPMWMWGWIGGAVGVGLLSAVVITWLIRRSALEAAMEIDRRFGLKERVASSFALHPEELESEAGHALIEDAVKRVSRIEVTERFGFSFNWRAALPLVAAVVVFALTVLPNAVSDPNQAAASVADAKQVKNATEALKKKIVEQRKKAEAEKGLKDAADMFKQFEEAVDEMAKKENADRKQAMIKLNDLAKDLEKRKEALGGADKMREQMKGMKNLNRGPADKIAQAMKEGNFQKALDEVKNLQEKLRNDELTEAEKKELMEQLSQMQKKLQDMVDAHERAKQELKERIKQAEKAGDTAQAGQLQQQLEKLQQGDKQMSRMQQMANKLGQCKECVQQGDNQAAASQLGQLSQELQDMQAELGQLETLDEMLDQIADAKDMMNCKNCNGMGCEACMGGMGMGMNGGMNDMMAGMGLGEGQGRGERPEERTDTSAYDSQVRDKPKPGEAVRVGEADGPNVAGVSRESDKAPLEFSLAEDADPLADQRLPRAQRDHAKQYFEALREGK
ncbi:MAG: hypothetical protein KY475_13875 [Planctomycetes bacterium]|nr:hypothetical protein [Planctomycetota bacterium]